MDDPKPGPVVHTGEPSQNLGDADLIIDLTNSATGRSTAAAPPPANPAGVELTEAPRPLLEPYIPDKQRDYVRLIVTVGLLLIFGFVVVWSCIEAASWPEHWAQTKEMLPYILPALTGLIGSVVGFYFGSGVNSTSTNGAGSNSPTK